MNEEMNNNSNENVPVQPTVEPVQPVVPQPVVEQPQPVVENTTVQKAPGKKKGKFIVLGIVLILVVIGLIFLLGGKGDDNTSKNDKDYVGVFSIKQNGKYALFNDKGKQLTDFIYDDISSFTNGTAVVEQNDKYGIINTSGKYVVELGKYYRIYKKSGFYEVDTEKDERGYRTTYLLDSKGKVLYDLDSEAYLWAYNSNYIVLTMRKTDKYMVYNSAGKLMLTFEENNDERYTASEDGGYLVINNSGMNYILELSTGKQIGTIKSESRFCPDDDDENYIFIKPCYSWTDTEDKIEAANKEHSRIIKNGKLVDVSDKCNAIATWNTAYGDNIKCTNKSGESYLLDSNFKLGTALVEWGNSYFDSNHYVKDNENNGWKTYSVDFYEGDKVIKNVPCTELYSDNKYSKQGTQILKTVKSSKCDVESGLYEYYNVKGEKTINKSFKSAEMFDDNGYAVVSDNKKTYYLINTKGEKVSEEYDRISASYNGEWYYVTKDGQYGLLNKKLKVLLNTEYEDISIYDYDNHIAVLKTKDSKYIIYNLNKGSQVLKLDEAPSMKNQYILVTKNGKSKYYTVSGKLFYEEK